MTKKLTPKMTSALLHDQVYGQWIARAEDHRRRADTVPFIDDLWDNGIKLGSSPSSHYQHVMGVIRTKITD